MTSFFCIGSSKTPGTHKIIHKSTESTCKMCPRPLLCVLGKQAASALQCWKLPGLEKGNALLLASRTRPGTLRQEIPDVDVNQIRVSIFGSPICHIPGSARQIGIFRDHLHCSVVPGRPERR